MKLTDIVGNAAKKYGVSENTPGFSVLLTHDDKTTLSFTVGIRDMEANPIETESNFRLASVTKQFTAASILQLTEKGKLLLSTTLCEVFSDFPSYGKSITVQHLLTHTSGIKDYEDQLDLINTPQISDEQVFLLAKQQDKTLFPPGSKYQYSNGAYCILALIVSKLSGRTLEEYLQENVFSVAGMSNACLNSTLDVPNRVYGFSYSPDEGWFANDQNKTSATQGDGGIYASTKELYLWQRSLYKDKKIISSEYVDLMTRPQILTDEAQRRYGFGIYITKIADEPCYQHGGDSVGFKNALFYLPNKDMSLALLSNLGGTDMMEVGTEILNSYIEETSVLWR